MRNDKGFTLVELLAVIAILAIVALITTPQITGVINNSRRSAAEDKAWGAMEAVNTAYVTDTSLPESTAPALDNGGFTFDFSSDTKIGITNVTMKGERPVSGTVTIKEDGTITCNNLVFEKNGKYSCSTDAAGNKMTCDKQ